MKTVHFVHPNCTNSRAAHTESGREKHVDSHSGDGGAEATKSTTADDGLKLIISLKIFSPTNLYIFVII